MKKFTFRKRYILYILLILIIGGVVTVRIYLEEWAADYINKVLANLDGYQGSIESVDISLLRGAYQIHALKIVKKNAGIPTPFVDIETVDFSVQWNALLHGRIVSNVDLVKPELNFAINRSGTVRQTGEGVDWTKPIQELSPIDINLVKIHDGKVTYQDFSTKPKANLYIYKIQGEARNLRNVVDAGNPLPSSLNFTGTSIGGGRLAFAGKLNILKPVPDMDLDVKLENVKMPALSDYTKAYAAIDIEEGSLNIYSELSIKNNKVKGYIKPIANNISIIDLRKPDPLKLIWETLVATVVDIFSNQRRDQFATKIPLSGSLDNVKTSTWPALGAIIRNAFVEAFKKGFDTSSSPAPSHQHQAPS